MTRLHRWPIFICYRRVDGAATARRLHEMLVACRTQDADGNEVELDPYLDENMPGVANWKELHRPYLEKARALIVICTPGAFIDEGENDWVHREIDWWIENRNQAPILVDPLMQEARFVPSQIARRWPDIQRISMPETEWATLSPGEAEQKAKALRRRVIGAILPSGAAIYEEELARERAQAAAEREAKQRATRMLKIAFGLLAMVVLLGVIAAYSADQSRKNEQIAKASRLDAQAAEQFQTVRQLVGRRASEWERRSDLIFQLDRELRAQPDSAAALPQPAETGAPADPPRATQDAIAPADAPPALSPEELRVRIENLRSEIAQAGADIRDLSKRAESAREQGMALLDQAGRAWQRIEARGGPQAASRRVPPPLPLVFSVEVLPAGYGESLLIHYGPIDRPRLILINTGPRRTYDDLLGSRLRELSERDHGGGPVPVQLVAIGDQDEDKIGGLFELLREIAEPGAGRGPPARIEGIWANIFRYEGGRPSLRNELRNLIDSQRIPLNRPLGALVVRPAAGRLVHSLEGGMKIMVLGPTRERLRALHRLTRRNAEQRGGRIEPFIDRDPQASRLALQLAPPAAPRRDPGCRPSRGARELAGGGYEDRSVPNLASSILLFAFEGRTFLHTGDSRGDLIIEGMAASGLLDRDGRAFVDLLNIPHYGSRRNLAPDFFTRIRAQTYLFNGDGRFGTPAIEVLAGLISARQCEEFGMTFTAGDRPPPEVRRNRPSGVSPAETMTLDAFFHQELRNRPNYRRRYLSPQRGSMFVDLIDPLPR